MRARLWRHDLTLRTPVRAAHQVHLTRTHLFFELEVDGVYGLGEVSPQPEPLNGDPGLDEVLVELEHFTVRQLFEVTQREGSPPDWSRMGHLAGSRRASRTASALVEMALFDWQLRRDHRTLDEQWPPRWDTPAQRTVSVDDAHDLAFLDDAAQLRVKVGIDPVPERSWRELGARGLPVLIDFNCSAGSIDDVVATVSQAREHLEVVAVEQPFAPGNVVEHARLAEVVGVAVSLDEGVRSRRDLDQIVRYRAASMVCVKPARVGGYSQARTVIERAHALGLEVYVGGFFESPLGRAANRVLAHHLVQRPSDIGDAPLVIDEQLLEVDPWGCGYLPGTGLASTTPLAEWTS